MSVEAVNEGLYRRFVQMTRVRRALSGLLTQHEGLWVDESESIDDDLSLHGLYGIDDHGDGTGS